MNIVTLEDVRTSATVQTDDELRIGRILEGTIEKWEEVTRRLWTRRASFEWNWRLSTRRKREKFTLYFPLYPVESISLEGWSSTETDADAVAIEVDGADVQVDLERGAVERVALSSWPYFVRATITGGYVHQQDVSSTNKIPASVREAIVTQTLFTMKRMSPEQVGLLSQAFEGGSTRFITKALHPIFEAERDGRVRRVQHG